MTTSAAGASEEAAIPGVGRWRMPAEWEPHERCLMAWPTRASLWHDLDEALRQYAGVANAIAAFEPVLMVTNPGDAAGARRFLTSAVELVELPIDDSWMRDNGPIFVVDGDGGRAGVHFGFNAWGERFPPWDRDAAVGEPLLAHLGIPRIPSAMILEGGSISVDGDGTLVTTEQCLLNPNRNPEMSREQIEAELRSRLGVDTIVWLPYGHAEDMHTDGHVDGVCVFVRPGVVVAQTCHIPDHPDEERMAANRAVLAAATDARGRNLGVIELPHYPYVDVGGERTRVSYANFYLANGGVIVPLAGHAFDDEVLELLAAAMPEREVVGVPAGTIASGGGMAPRRSCWPSSARAARATTSSCPAAAACRPCSSAETPWSSTTTCCPTCGTSSLPSPTRSTTPANRHSVPKDYGITSFWWRAEAVKEDPRTLEECFALLPSLKGATVNFIESSNETINAALAATGSSINATDDAALERARDLLLEAKPYIDTISATYIERGERGEIDFGLGYNGDVHRIQQAREKEGDEIKFLIPEGPAQSYVDLWVIPAEAEHPVAAHKFINSILEPRAAAREMSYTGFGVPVAGVERYEPELARNPVVSIPDEAIGHYEVAGPYAPDVARKRDKIYTEFKSA